MSDSHLVQPLQVPCSGTGCQRSFEFAGGTIDSFVEQFNACHDEGWFCLMESPLEMFCPQCHAARGRTIQRHQVLRRRLAGQLPWRRDLVVLLWAAMAHEPTDDYLRATEAPMWLGALLGNETASATHVHNALEQIARVLSSHNDNPDAIAAARVAKTALRQ